MDSRNLCLQLVRTDDEEEVHDILCREALNGAELWVPLGHIENNLSIAGNQQSSATAAQVEKLVNSIDSLLVRECLLRGIDPESVEAPDDMITAASSFFAVPNGNIASLKPKDRARLAELVQLVATGDKRQPSYTIVDQGEGQRPCDFHTTFCSLVRSNKLRIPFVQGKFNMGGCGVLPFCGERNMQLVISRRHPSLTAGEDGVSCTGWGWTIVRRREPDHRRRSSFYEYLAPDGAVPCFEADSIPVLPSKDLAYGKPLSWGSLVKLYNYQTEFPSSVVFDLNFELSRRLYRLALPIRLYERRDYRGHSKGTILTGMSVRIEDDRAGVIESGFPDSGVIAVDGVGEVPVQVTVFNKSKGKVYVSRDASILFLVNGQVHGALNRRFCTRKTVALDYLKDDLMVVLDCTEISARCREDLFMPSRDRLRMCPAKQAFETALEEYLRDHLELDQLNRRRREEELQGRLTDDQPLNDALRSVINSSPELRSLFQVGVRIPVPEAPGMQTEEFCGVKFPTFFRPTRQPADSDVLEVKCPAGGTAQVRFETDAENEYFTREDRPGAISLDHFNVFQRIHLHDGRASLTLQCPEALPVGESFETGVEVTDPSRTGPFRHMLRLVVTEPKEPHESDSDSVPPKAGALALPKIVEVTQEFWEQESFGPESGLSMQNDVDGGIVAKVNSDNEHLKRTLDRTTETDRDVVRKQFTYGLVLAGISLWQEYSDDENCDEIIRTATKAVARILLPTISVLGELRCEPTGS